MVLIKTHYRESYYKPRIHVNTWPSLLPLSETNYETVHASKNEKAPYKQGDVSVLDDSTFIIYCKRRHFPG